LTYFFDSSVFVKLFVQETGTASTIELYDATDSNFVSSLVSLEVRSAIRRREYEGDLTSLNAEKALRFLNAELIRVKPVELTTVIFATADEVIDRHRLRALDALQLATALVIAPERGTMGFVSSDTRLLKAAQAEGFVALDPTTF
jgi:uncharacterized protein